MEASLSLIFKDYYTKLILLACLSLFLAPAIVVAQTYQLTSLTTDNNTSLRGLSIVSDSVAWVSGSNGSIGKTINGGKEWKWMKPAGFEKLDFRDIEAFDENYAVAVNAGAPAYILVTEDGGISWKQTYNNLDSAIFLDGMDFWSAKRGIIFGDPINKKIQLLSTQDAGRTWKDISSNLTFETADGEAGFAASGSSIKALPGGKVWIVTGGLKSNLYSSDDYGATWKRSECPIIQGKNSTGAFSLDFYDRNKGLVVGGDYTKDRESNNNVLLTDDGGKSWRKPARPVAGYRSGVIWFDEKNCIATGTSGTDVSRDGGKNWYTISEDSFNVVKRAKSGKVIMLAGNKGVIYTLTLN